MTEKKKSNSKTLNRTQNNPKKSNRKVEKDDKKKGRCRKSGPRLPSSLLQELDHLNPKTSESDSDGEGRELPGDLYEYEEDLAQEETKKNRRFDPVENYEYELPEDFKDEDVPSDDDDDGDDDEDIPSDQSDGEPDGDEGEKKHIRMLEGITGMPGEAFDGKEKKEVVLTNLQGDMDNVKISVNDLLEPLHGKDGYNKLRKRIEQLKKKPMIVQAPLPKVERERVERKVAFEHSKKDITKWEPLVKRNREAPTLYFQEDEDVGVPTVGAIASGFIPRTEFEKKMASLVRDPEVADAHWKDGAKLLELNEVSVEDVRERQNHLAKMRSLLFSHEIKAKHVKKIKSKAYHRILKKEKLKAAASENEMDSEAIKDLSMKQEFKRAEERMTLKHKNSSKWAKRVLKRGLQVQDEGTRAAISEQLRQHALLTRKMNSMENSSSSDESSDDDDDDDDGDGDDDDRVSKLLNRAKEKTLKVIGEEEKMPKSGVISLPFMQRGLRKKKEAADEEARHALQEYESSLGRLGESDRADCQRSDKQPGGRKVFGATKVQSSQQPKKILESDNTRNSDSEDEIQPTEQNSQEVKNELQEVHIRSALFPEESDMGQNAIFQNFNEITKDPGPKTAYDVAIFASGSWKKMKQENGLNVSTKKSMAIVNSFLPTKDIKVMDQNSDSDSDEEMVDGILSAGSMPNYELPSQSDLIHRAFAGDDVEAEFEKDKMELLNEENPEPEKPLLLPGWGQWTHIQQKRGPPSWMFAEHESAKRKREEALKKRKDSNLKHVIISEKIDKKAEKLHANALPFPYKSKDVYEQSIRMPLGPEYNPAVSVGALNRPAVVKKPGSIIKPIKYEEVDPYGKIEEPQHSSKKPKAKKPKLKGTSKHLKKKA